MENHRPVTPTPDRDATPRTREEPATRPRLQLEALEPRLAPTSSSGGGDTWPL